MRNLIYRKLKHRTIAFNLEKNMLRCFFHGLLLENLFFAICIYANMHFSEKLMKLDRMS